MKSNSGKLPAFRVIHRDNLHVYLTRERIHAANHIPDDGLPWRALHNHQVQNRRATTRVPAGAGGVMLDYAPFHFGPRNIFLYNLHTNYVHGVDYTEGQGPLITLVIDVHQVAQTRPFVFYDGHALSALSTCDDDLAQLAQLDWKAIDGTYWPNSEPELKRCKQAEFMVHEHLPWELVRGIAVCDEQAQQAVEAIQSAFPQHVRKRVIPKPQWYF